MSELNQTIVKQVLDAIRNALSERKISYREETEGGDDFTFFIEYRGHRIVASVNADIRNILLIENLPLSVNPAAVPHIVEACNRFNLSKFFGAFACNEDKRAVYYYNSLLFSGSVISKHTIDETLMFAVQAAEEFLPRLDAINREYAE